MARSSINLSNPNSSQHSALPLPLFIACIAAIVTIVGALCGTHAWKHLSGKSENKNKNRTNVVDQKVNAAPTKLPSSALVATKFSQVQEQDTRHQMKELKRVLSRSHTMDVPENLLYPLPLPAGSMSGRRASLNPTFSRPASQHRRISRSLSMRLPSFSRIRPPMKEPDRKANDDCIWKKAIILGERCRVPAGAGTDDTVYDEKGNQIVVYTPRRPRSLPVSRSTSLIDPKAIPRLC